MFPNTLGRCVAVRTRSCGWSSNLTSMVGLLLKRIERSDVNGGNGQKE